MLITIILIIIFLVLMLLLGSGMWATAWPWIHFVRPDEPRDDAYAPHPEPGDDGGDDLLF